MKRIKIAQFTSGEATIEHPVENQKYYEADGHQQEREDGSPPESPRATTALSLYADQCPSQDDSRNSKIIQHICRTLSD
jgi:hypothetical protein